MIHPNGMATLKKELFIIVDLNVDFYQIQSNMALFEYGSDIDIEKN